MYANENTLDWLDANSLSPPTLVPENHPEYSDAVWVVAFVVDAHDKTIIRRACDSDFEIYEQQFSGRIPQIVWYLIAKQEIADFLL